MFSYGKPLARNNINGTPTWRKTPNSNPFKSVWRSPDDFSKHLYTDIQGRSRAAISPDEHLEQEWFSQVAPNTSWGSACSEERVNRPVTHSSSAGTFINQLIFFSFQWILKINPFVKRFVNSLHEGSCKWFLHLWGIVVTEFCAPLLP